MMNFSIIFLFFLIFLWLIQAKISRLLVTLCTIEIVPMSILFVGTGHSQIAMWYFWCGKNKKGRCYGNNGPPWQPNFILHVSPQEYGTFVILNESLWGSFYKIYLVLLELLTSNAGIGHTRWNYLQKISKIKFPVNMQPQELPKLTLYLK